MKIDFIDIDNHISKIDLEYISADELKALREKTKLTHLISQDIKDGYVECYIRQDFNSRLIPYEYKDGKKTYFYIKSDNTIEL